MQIKPVKMWVTPKTQQELQELVTGLNSPEAIHAMMYTWNYFAEVTKFESENGYVCPGCDIDCTDCQCPD